jgi:hypothetical protein
MTGDVGPATAADAGPEPGATPESGRRRATITTTHADAATAGRVAASLRPDNTAEMATRTDGDRVVTTVTRGDTGGLRSTLDDYVVNATVAVQLTTDSDTPATHSDNDTS